MPDLKALGLKIQGAVPPKTPRAARRLARTFARIGYTLGAVGVPCMIFLPGWWSAIGLPITVLAFAAVLESVRLESWADGFRAGVRKTVRLAHLIPRPAQEDPDA